MKKKLILMLSVLLILGSLSTSYAADDNTATDNIITLEKAKALAVENSRSLKKYEIGVDKAKYQQQQTEDQENDNWNRYNSMSAQYSSLSEQYYQLLEIGDTEGAQAIEEKMNQIEKDMDSQYEKSSSTSDSIEDAEDDYDDSVKAEENYRKQLDYIVEDLYTTILTQEEILLKDQKEYEIKQSLLNIERKKLALGSSSQYKVNQLSAEVTNLNKNIIELTDQIKIKKGQLNDMTGRGYDEALKLVPFAMPVNTEIPEFERIFSSASQSYDLLSQIKRDINKMDDQQDEENDYYKSRLLDLGIQEKELQLEDEKKNLNDIINNLITAAKSRQEEYQIALTNYINAQKSYEWDKKRYDLGQISKLDFMQSELNYQNTKNNKDSKGYDLYMAQHSLDLAKEGIFVSRN